MLHSQAEMKQGAFVQLLTGREAEAIIRTLAMMAYNPAIGRVLEEVEWIGSRTRFPDCTERSVANPLMSSMLTRVPRFSRRSGHVSATTPSVCSEHPDFWESERTIPAIHCFSKICSLHK